MGYMGVFNVISGFKTDFLAQNDPQNTHFCPPISIITEPSFVVFGDEF